MPITYVKYESGKNTEEIDVAKKLRELARTKETKKD